MKKVFLLCAMLGALSSCSSPEERAQARAQKEIDACTKQGFTPDTPAFDNCRLKLEQAEEQRKAARMDVFDGMQQLDSNHHLLP